MIWRDFILRPVAGVGVPVDVRCRWVDGRNSRSHGSETKEELMQLRDHDQPCEHGSFINCDLGCPGGRLVQINYEAAQRKAESYGYEAGKFETRPDRTKAVVDAALGVEQ